MPLPAHSFLGSSVTTQSSPPLIGLLALLLTRADFLSQAPSHFFQTEVVPFIFSRFRISPLLSCSTTQVALCFVLLIPLA